MEEIPPDVYIRCYNQLKRIRSDHSRPYPMERSCQVFWGRTGSGKSMRAFNEASVECYVKDPLTKWWDGYGTEEDVVIDEFRGIINIAHLLRWTDRYPVRLETKGGSVVSNFKRIWITSNLDPREWYPEADNETKLALLRRLNITHFN